MTPRGPPCAGELFFLFFCPVVPLFFHVYMFVTVRLFVSVFVRGRVRPPGDV